MSLRRKSCEACFKGRRKCDLNHPACKRCQKNQRACHYLRPPFVPSARSVSSEVASLNAIGISEPIEVLEQQVQNEDFSDDFNWLDQIESLQQFSIPSFLGSLGELQPVFGNTKSWEWVIEQLKSLPQSFAQNAETTFIHKELYRDHLPSPIRAAFGICSAFSVMNDNNRSIVLRSLKSESNGLFQTVETDTLLEALSKLQALVLYQIIRMYHGDLEQRIMAEQQESSVAVYGIQLLRRADHELQGKETNWDNWMLADSIRRTVLASFMLYSIYSIFKHGVCITFPTLSILPVSTFPGQWKLSPDAQQPVMKDTMKYKEYTERWVASPQVSPEPFEKMLLVACKGLDQVEALVFPADLI